ncbi:MAG: YqgE/AlgH family protein [Acidimicrobiales bacterium]
MSAPLSPSVTKGRLLVASPSLDDPNFERSVVFMIEHSDEGALGLVLNRPSGIELLGPLPEWSRLATEPSVVFVGGPVSQGSAIALARLDRDGPVSGFEPVLGRLGVIDLGEDPDLIGGPVDDLRVFTGYAGWGSAQLEAELDQGAWWVVDAQPGDAFSDDPDTLWRRVLRRQRPPLNRFALYPPDPSLN